MTMGRRIDATILRGKYVLEIRAQDGRCNGVPFLYFLPSIVGSSESLSHLAME